MTKKQIEKKAEELGIKYQTPCHGVGDCEFEARQAATEMAEWLLFNQWMSVEDELPPRPEGGNCSERVIVRTELYAILTDCYDHKNECWMRELNDKVTHWMPIPPLAEEGGEK